MEKAIVYIVGTGEAVKIGYTVLSYAEKRISNLRADSVSVRKPSVLFIKLFDSKEIAEHNEKMLHFRFRKHRLDGEKFLAHNEIVEFIASHNHSFFEENLMDTINKVNDVKPLPVVPDGKCMVHDGLLGWHIIDAPTGNDKHMIRYREIDPIWARDVLSTRNFNNRSKKKRRVDQLATDIDSDKFVVTPDAIAFDRLGCLMNGQHRLSACADQGKKIMALIGFNFPNESFGATDKGTVRSDVDTAKTTGRDLSASVISALNYSFTFAGKNGSQTEKEFLWDNYGDIAKKFCEILKKAPFSQSSIRCAFIKAEIFYTKHNVDCSFLNDAAMVLNSGEAASPEEKNMWQARESVLSNDRKRIAGRKYLSSGSGIKDAYLAVATGIERMRRKETDKKFKRLEKDPFPLW